jgi:cell division protein ZapB
MLDEFDALAAKLRDLTSMVHTLRGENQHLRAQLVAASSELDAMRERVDNATQRLDALLERLPDSLAPEEQRWSS